ncbi:MAG: putative DNA binding domain-containing protein [Anaerolineales bacterium]|nr:putative DNA binding domain-containing protein [Anaerolineales bacterium]
MKDKELLLLFNDLESDRVERKESWNSSKEKIREAICAFANDLPNYKLPGVIFVGVKDNGECAGLTITDELLTSIAQCKDDGNIVPFPTMVVQKHVINGCNIVAIIVEPSHSPPVRVRGRVWIRVGPRRAIASPDDERILNEKRRSKDLPFDLRPVHSASIDDLDMGLFQRTYLPSAVAFDVLEENQRPLGHQLVSLRLLNSIEAQIPTVVGILTIGKTPREHIYGAYVQFLRMDGSELTDPVIDQKELDSPLPDTLRLLDDLLEINIATSSTFVGSALEVKQPDYPIEALRQLIRNAILHRSYEATNTPVRITWFNDRIEIFSPGGLFGQVNEANLGHGATDYRNPHIAEALKNLGFVQRFGFGIPIAEKALKANGNPPIKFQITSNSVLAIVRGR